MLDKPNPADFVNPRGSESWADFLTRTAWVTKPPFQSKFGALRLDQIDDPGPEQAWLVSGFLTMRDKSVIAGESKSGKTFLALEVALDVAFARQLFGLKVKPGGVIYQAGEGAAGCKKRLRAWRQFYGVEYTHDVPFVLLQKPIDIYNDRTGEKTDELIKEINAHAATFNVPLGLVVIDTLAKATPGADENSIKDMGPVMSNVDRIQDATHAHVMLIHHLSKEGRVRGHGSVYANCDQVLLVTRDEATKVRTVKLDKQKDDEEGVEISFELKRVVLGKDEDGRDVSSCVCIAVADKEAVRRGEAMKGLRLSFALENFMRAFFDAETRYGYPVPRQMEMPASVRSITPWADVKRFYADASPSSALTPDQQTTVEAARSSRKHQDALRVRIGRHQDELKAQGVLGFGRDGGVEICWFTGRPLRAFPHTQRAAREEDDPALQVEF